MKSILGDRDECRVLPASSKRARYCKTPNACRSNGRGRCKCMGRVPLKDVYPSEYGAWVNMKTRCGNKNYSLWHRYGGRGITVCDRWRGSFDAFLADVGPKPFPSAMLDRIDNDGNYSSENVRWVNPSESSRNREIVRQVSAFGVSLILPEWEQISGRNRKTIWRRIKDGWPAELAIGAPPMPRDIAAQKDPIGKYYREWVRGAVSPDLTITGMSGYVLHHVRRGTYRLEIAKDAA